MPNLSFWNVRPAQEAADVDVWRNIINDPEFHPTVLETAEDLLSSGKYTQSLEEILMHRNAIDRGMIHLKDNVYFNKKGKDVSSQIGVRLTKLSAEIEAAKVSVVDICKKREVNLDEVLKDKDVNSYMSGEMNEDTLYANSVSFSNTVKAMSDAPMVLAKAVTADLRKIIKAAQVIVSTGEQMEHLKRVQTNLNGDETYKLFYQDLLEFGF